MDKSREQSTTLHGQWGAPLNWVGTPLEKNPPPGYDPTVADRLWNAVQQGLRSGGHFPEFPNYAPGTAPAIQAPASQGNLTRPSQARILKPSLHPKR